MAYKANSTFINRDINACINIISISDSWINLKKRPLSFCRNSNLDFENKIKQD